MTNGFECSVDAGEEAVFGALVDVVQSIKAPNMRLWAVKVSVNPSRFGVEEAFSVRLRNPAGEGEIGKITIRPLHGTQHLLKVPKNRTGGAKPPELDPKGSYFNTILKDLLGRLVDLGMYTPPSAPEDKGPIGFRPQEDTDAP